MRVDPIVGRQVLIAEHRAGRPNDFVSTKPPVARSTDEQAARADCPFCVGHESMTPAALVEVVDAAGDWQVRVVPNRYPAVAMEAGEPVASASRSLFSTSQPPRGSHEVVIESPRHIVEFTDLSLRELAGVLRVYRDRLHYWAAEDRMQHVSLFKNSGVAAGASLEHVHSQVVALPSVPPVIEAELRGAREHFQKFGRCIFCQLVDVEAEQGERLVTRNDQFVAFCPYAARQPYETWVLPTTHDAHFEQLADAQIDALARVLQQILQRLASRLSPLSYNLILHTAPFGSEPGEYYHWHWELIPRSAELAGLEWGSGLYINHLAPERAAALLRDEGS